MILTKMAASLSVGLIIKRAITKTTASSTFISKAISPPNPIISPMFGTICKHNRSFSTEDSKNNYVDDSGKEYGAIVTHYPGLCYISRAVFDVSEGVSDEIGHPFAKGKCGSLFEIKRIKDGLYVRIDFPGLRDKDDVKITFEKARSMIVKGERETDTKTATPGKSYLFRLHFALGLYNTNGVHFSVKDGVLRIVIPRMVKDDDVSPDK